MLFLFALPGLVQGLMHAPAQSLIQGIYAKHAGLPLAALGTAVLISRIFDAITDPLIGWTSDRWRQRGGSRKLFVAVGTVVTMLGLWFLYRPPQDVTIGYFLGWFLVSYLGWTIIEIPYRAWSFELSSDYRTRTRIQTWIALFVLLGALMFYAVPAIGQALGWLDSPELDLKAMALAAVFIVVLMPLANLLAIWKVPDGQAAVPAPRESLRELGRVLLGNRPLMHFCAVFTVIGLVLGVGQGTVYLYLDSYLGLSDKIAAILGGAAIISIVAIPFWGWLCQRYDRVRVWAVSALGTAACLLGYGLVSPGEGALQLILPMVVAAHFFMACTAVVAPATIGDVSDYGRWQFNRDHGGLYMSTFTLVQKAVTGLGVAAGLFLLDAFGFDATASSQSDSGEFGIKLAIAWLPAVLVLAVTPLIWWFPLNRARHQALTRELAERDEAAVQIA